MHAFTYGLIVEYLHLNGKTAVALVTIDGTGILAIQILLGLSPRLTGIPIHI